MPAHRLRISGKVQGVYYRESAKAEALRLGLVGWVQNLPDGRVEAEAQGADAALNEFEKWCRNGPSAARVDDVETTPIEPFEAADFVVRR